MAPAPAARPSLPSVRLNERNQLRGQAPSNREQPKQGPGHELDDDFVARLEPKVAPAADGGEVVDEAQRPAQGERDQDKAAGERAVGDDVKNKGHGQEHDATGGRRPRLGVVGGRTFLADLLAHPGARQPADGRGEHQGADDEGREKNDEGRHDPSRICSTTRSSRIPREPLTSTWVCGVSSGPSAATTWSAPSTT